MLPVLLAAQGEQGPTAESVYEELSTKLIRQATAYKDARKNLQQSEAFMAARKARDNDKLRQMLRSLNPPDTVGLAKEAIEWSAKFEDPGAAKLLGWAAVTCRNTDMVKEIVAKIEQDHLKSEGLLELLETGSILARPLGEEAADAFLQKVIEQNEHKLVKAWALFWRGNFLGRRAANDDGRIAAQAMINEAEELAAGTYLAWKIGGPKFRKERLQIGMVVPNIVGEDLDGVTFEIEDYRGKVVVLDFWGFW